MTSISPRSLHQHILSGRKLHLLDVRTPREFAQAHVAAAVLAPLENFEPERLARQFCVSADAPMYVLCQSGSRAKRAIARLQQAGVSPCVLVEGGTQGWIQAGLPVEGEAVSGISLERQVRIAAGFLVLLGTVLGFFWHPAFLGLSAFVGAGLVFAGITDICGMGMMLARMPWNRLDSTETVFCFSEKADRGAHYEKTNSYYRRGGRRGECGGPGTTTL